MIRVRVTDDSVLIISASPNPIQHLNGREYWNAIVVVTEQPEGRHTRSLEERRGVETRTAIEAENEPLDLSPIGNLRRSRPISSQVAVVLLDSGGNCRAR